MPRPSLRSRTKKRELVRTPRGLVVHIVDVKHDYPKCAVCKRPLHGFSKMTAREERRGHRPPARVYGGYLCSKCLRMGLKAGVDATFTASK